MADFTQTMKNLGGYLTYSQINRILNYCVSINDKDTYMLILTLSRTGRRVSEIVGIPPFIYAPGLRPKDIHIEDGMIEWTILKKNHIYHTKKTKKGQIRKLSEEKYQELLKDKYLKPARRKLVPADRTFLKMLARYSIIKNKGAEDRIFAYTRQGVWYKVKRVVRELGMETPDKPINPKIFRHSLAVNYIKNKARDPSALIKLKEILAHSRIDITAIYLQFGQRDIQEDFEKMFG